MLTALAAPPRAHHHDPMTAASALAAGARERVDLAGASQTLLLGEGERRHLIAASALDPDWPEQVEAAGDVLVVVEGLTMYLTEDQVRGLMGIIAGSLPGAMVLVEVMPRLFQRYGRERSVVATGARFTYGCSGAEELRRTVAPGFALLHDVLTYGWAYGPAGTALHGKELALAVSPGGPAAGYTHAGSVHYELHELLRPFQATSDLIGTRFAVPFLTPGAMSLTDEELAERARDYAAWLAAPDHPRLGAFE